MRRTDVIPVPDHLIDRGIIAYGGKEDEKIQAILNSAELPYQAYRFRDDRILLIYSISNSQRMGFLYPSEDALYNHLELEH